MLSKKNKLNKKEANFLFSQDFSKIGKIFYTPYLTLRFCFKKENKAPRVSFFVSKKNCSKAVDRNFLKRRGFFLSRKYLSLLPPGFLGVFIFSKQGAFLFKNKKKSKNKENNPLFFLERDILNLLKKIKIIKNE